MEMEQKIALLAGDGIGPEIIREAVKVMDAVGAKFGHRFTYEKGLVGAAAIDATGDPYPEATHRICQEAGIVLFGAIGDPKYDNDPSAKVRPEQGLLRMRKSLGLFANIRPLVMFDALADRSPLKREIVQGADFVCIRELTGGMYFGRPQGRSEDGNTAYDTCVYTREEVERILHLAFKQAQTRRKKLTVVDKANVIATSRLWRQIAQELAPAYPDVTLEHMFVDNAAMQLIQWPTRFDVIVTENLFGDILTDEASVISGSLGMLPSASVGAEVALFEPIHGSYPQAAGKNIANPMATILSAAMLLEHIGLRQEGAAVRSAIDEAVRSGIVTEDIAEKGVQTYTTSQVGDYVAAFIRG
jgi:3-isopropylmalate dehydrogenase